MKRLIVPQQNFIGCTLDSVTVCELTLLIEGYYYPVYLQCIIKIQSFISLIHKPLIAVIASGSFIIILPGSVHFLALNYFSVVYPNLAKFSSAECLLA